MEGRATMNSNSTAAFVLVLAATTVAACATNRPRPPLMSPFVDNGEYGYADKKLGDERYQVTYFGPRIRVPVNPSRRPPFIDRAKQQANELALWRSAQLSQANGKIRFSVVNKESDVQVDVNRNDGYYPRYSYPFRYRRRGYGYWGYPYPYGFYAYPSATARVQVVLTVTFHDKSTKDSYDAAQVIREFRHKFGPVVTKPKPGKS